MLTVGAARIRMLALVALLFGLTFAPPGMAFDHDEYELIYHESGKVSEGYAPGRYGQKEWVKRATGGFSIFTRGNLMYFVERNHVLIFRPSEGLWVNLSYDSDPIRKNPDGTKTVNFSRLAPGTEVTLWGMTNAEVVRSWDQAAANPQQWSQFFSPGVKTPRAPSNVIRGHAIPMVPGHTVFENIENYLSSTTAAQAVPGIAAARAWEAGAQGRKAQAQIEAQARRQATRARTDEIRVQAERRFRQASASPKAVGATVCSADNRLAYVEQVAGSRIRLTLRGIAVGRSGEFGEYGPHSLRIEGLPENDSNYPIQDPNFLFHPLPKPIQVSNISGVIWDETQYWGICDYR